MHLVLFILLLVTSRIAAAQPHPSEGVRRAEQLQRRYDRERTPALLIEEAAAWREANRCFEASRAAQMLLTLPSPPPVLAARAQHILLDCALRNADLALAQGRTDDALATLTHTRTLLTAERDQRQLTERVHAIRAAQRERRASQRPSSISQVAASQVLGQSAAVAAGLPIGPVPTLAAPTSPDEGLDLSPDQRHLQECAARLAVSHWLLPTIQSLSKMSLQGLLLHQRADGLAGVDEPPELPLLLRLPFSSKEIRLVPQWNPNAPGARVHIRF
jgi:hypothetical protein